MCGHAGDKEPRKSEATQSGVGVWPGGLGLFGFPYFSLQVRAGGNPGIYAGQRPTQAHL